ncbi:GNAT family N-acetyltransferase [Chitinophaga ginsengisoli]|uniref:RimJ/RimL family protein N-acetyltransferase n=1 Tax=Chitinophaga ginsengisoli TaxID=363837 RepID=A0A2P8GI05_9BACT|nr:GNAT family protein [Chitinophaga ginsengisoli]PSL33606.1 RimJ/RimL family protein N-acetyltransferase [Chitinophaga ginsengisoli]
MDINTIIEGAHSVSLRNLQPADATAMSELANNPAIARNLRNVFPYPYSREDAVFYIGKAREGAWGICQAIHYQDTFAGVISLLPQEDVYRHTAEIGYWLGEPFWHKGIMTEAIRLVCRHAFSQTGIIRIYAGVFSYNRYSAAALIKNGFVLEGIKRKAVLKYNELFDEHFYALLKS